MVEDLELVLVQVGMGEEQVLELVEMGKVLEQVLLL